ncbi:MAG: GIY-YIG nuclease family protein [Gammaproteobacteria bacterium]|nr:GIY-YIG nuclease family protein [Gammaproteobacteria bacterium]
MTTSGDDNNWRVYLLKCNDGSLYCGITNNLIRRMRQHSGELKGGAKYTLSRKPCTIVYQEQASSRSDALKRELEIKKMSKMDKEATIASAGQ